MRSYEFINLVSSRAVQLDEETRRYNVKSLLTNFDLSCTQTLHMAGCLKVYKIRDKKGKGKTKKKHRTGSDKTY